LGRAREIHAVSDNVLAEKCIVNFELFKCLLLLFQVVKFLFQPQLLIFYFGLNSDVALFDLNQIRVKDVSVFDAWSFVQG